MKTIHNLETGEIIERDLNAEEIAQAKLDEKIAVDREAAKQKAAEEKLAVLNKLGLTADEVAALLG